MKSSTLLPLLTTLSLLPLTSGWSITWNDPSGDDHTRTGHGPSACIPIDNPKGHLFRIDAQGETGINMLLFTNGDCAGDPAGMATDVFSKDASKDLLGFKVVKIESATATATGTATGSGENSTVTGTMTATSKTHSSHVATTGGSASASASSSSVASTTTQVIVTSVAATTSASGIASSSSSSAASASTSNAAVRVAGSSADVAMGVLGGMIGLVVVPMMI